ncbi:MAG: ATP-binding protein [Verrucomicrobiia bacterium]
MGTLKQQHHGPVWRPLLGALFAVAAIGLTDWAITSELSVSLLYLVPVGLSAWLGGRLTGVFIASTAAVAWFLAEWMGGSQHFSLSGLLWQSGSRLGFYFVTALLVSRIRTLTLGLEALVKERTSALEAEVRRRKEVEQEAAEITEREQERIAQELHDGLAAYLAGVAFRIKTVAENLHRRGIPEAAETGDLVDRVNEASGQVRSLAHLLAPVQAGDGGLAVALSRLGAEAETVYGITCTVDTAASLPNLTSDQTSQLYRVAQECVRNAVQHSRGELVQITCGSVQAGRLRLSVSCDGKAWDPSRVATTGLGIRIMRHRTERLGGTLSIRAGTEGGTVVVCEVPMNDALVAAASESAKVS